MIDWWRTIRTIEELKYSYVDRVRCMAVWNTAKEEILFTDLLLEGIGVLDTKSGSIEIFAGKPGPMD